MYFVSYRNCGEMAMKGKSAYKAGPVCGSGAKILYAWAMDAPALSLPEGRNCFDFFDKPKSCWPRISFLGNTVDSDQMASDEAI